MVPGTPIASPTLAEIEHAARELQGVVLETPLVPLRDGEHANLWLKLETLQPVGSFKLRDVHHAVRARLAESGASVCVAVAL